MNPLLYLGVLLCVLCIGIGQILFKATAISMQETGSLFATRTLVTLSAAFVVYSGTAIGWICLLRYVDLGRIYPFNALAFVLVPAMSAWFFGERFGVGYLIGLLLIGAGIVMCARS